MNSTSTATAKEKAGQPTNTSNAFGQNSADTYATTTKHKPKTNTDKEQ